MVSFSRLGTSSKKCKEPSSWDEGVTSFVYRELESRIVFDAALGVTVDALGIDGLSPDDSGTDAGADTAEHSDASHAEQDDAGSAADAGENAEASEESAVDQLMDVALADFVEQSDTATSIVFIDSSVDNIEDLIADIDSSCELVIIDSETDGVDLIADILSSRSDIDSIHIISHSEAGTLYLGTAVLDIDSMSGEYADELAAIGDALTDDADILVYGCNFAQGEVGQQAVAQLSALTGADIAASDDLTGASELGGDWDLEVESGSIETDEILDSDTASDWDYLLDSSPSDLTAESGNVQTQYALDTSGDNTALISEELDVDGQGSFTIETTINLETLSSSGWAGNIVEQYSTSENAGFYLYIYDNQLTYIQNNDSSTAIKADVGDLTTGEHSIALVVDGADVSIYIDGTLVANGTESSAMSDSTADLYFFSGLETQVSEIRIWDTALSATDISNYLGADLDGDESNLLALYEFTEGSGETVSDSTVNGYDLTVYDTSASWIAYDYEGLSFNVDATDADADDTISYALTNDASGNFSIDSDTGEVSWSGSDFDISTTQSFDIAVQATDANSNSYVESFSIDIGTDGADSLSADSSNDSVLYGFDGDDTLTSGGGDDLILGGEGDDTVVFTNDYSDYTINYDSETGYIIVTDNTGDDGTDYLTGVDYLQFADQTISVTSAATQFNNRPAITSNSGSKSASISLEENTTSVMTIEASDDDDTLTYSISGGADASLFTIDSETGELSFVTAPDYESPTDSGTDNVYEVTVTVSDGNGGTDSQALAVTVTDDSFEGSITVTTTDDTVDGDTSSISALLSDMGDDGAISLREALIAANNTTGSDTIILSSGTYTLSIEGESEDLCATGDLDVVDDVTILGEGMGSTIIDANGIDRVLEVSSGSLELSDVTLTGGELSNGLGAGLKIKSGASATLTSVDVNGNTITTSGGGAGISNTGTLSMTGGYVRNNSITGGLGGGIQSLNASMTLDSVAVVNNESSVSGGGIYVSSGTATITNSTIGGNTAYYFGGGLYSGSTVTITYSTIANNTASTTGGGGIHNEGTLTLGATIVADNSASNGTNDINGAITSLGYNIIEDTTGTSGTEATDITGTDPGLGTLSDNGGDTLTYAITESSIAYDASGISAPSTDQRGVTRGASADIGAFEVATSNPVITSDDGGDSATLSLAEGETGVTTVTATNEETDETLAYSITGGADADLFTIDSETGALTFVSSPDYENPTDSDGDNVYEVIVQVSDSEGGTDSQTLTITVTNETQAPTVSLPSSFTLAEDNTVTFSSGNSNAITVDAESGSSVTVTLSVENGTLTLSQTTGLTISEGSNGSASLTIVGSVEDVNAALEGLTYVPSLDYVGSASLNISVQDTLWLQATNDASLVARYTFDDSSDLGADSSGNGNDITIYGGASSTDDDQGSVLDLDAGDYGSISGTYGSPESLTLAGWVNLETSGNSGSELISLGNVLLRLDTIKGGVVASFYDGTEWHHVESDTTIEGTGWHYIAFTFDADSNTQTLYIDGVAVASLSETVSISYSGVTSSFIGIHGTKTTVNLDGQVDDIRVYSSALSADEIAALALQTPSDSNSLTITIYEVNDDPTGSVTISGTATEDQTLSADTSTIADADGLGAFSYQWYRDGVAISGATNSTYTLTNDDVGAAITVGVSYTDANGTAESLTSDATAAVTNVNDDPTGSVTISGTATEDQTLSADTSTIADADGLGAFSYQWYRDGVAISGATGSTYTLTNDDVGAAITVGVSYTDANGTAESLTSDATAVVTNVNDDPTGSVTISGTATEDQTLSADTSTIADADGLGAFSYQWYRDGVAISGATNSTYTLSNDDVGAAITVGVSYTDANGTAESLTSDATAAVTNVNDDPTGSVTISGTATEDQTLSADTSTIADADGLGAFSYQWYRDGVAISAATGSTYTLTNDDVGAAITVGVSYTDANGTAESLTSDATAAVTNVNDDPTGSVTISGTATEDQTLSADTSTIADADGLGAFSYQWYRDGVAISGATGSTYTLTNDDVGAAITVGVSYTDANGTAESLTSGATAAVTNVNDDPTGSVTISGTATEDQTLSADTSTIADADGLGAFSYQWYRDGVAISGATNSTYTLTNDDVGAAITVGVSYTDANGTAESLTSDATAAVTNVNDDPTGSVTISGTATEDQTLSADTSTIADADGLGAFSYQWYRDGVAISGATGSTYTLTNDDVGAAITVGVSYTDANGTAESLTSDATAVVTNVNDDPTGSVTISGTATEEEVLTADTSTIADADGLGAFSYQWYRDGVAISGATNSTYTLTNDDVGAAITVGVSYTDANGTAESLTSDATAAVTNVNDDPTGSVTISGTATEDQTLSADTSTIADADGLGAFSYQWYRDGVAISGATGSTYTLTNDDVGAAITVGVSYTDANGTAESLTSDATAVVTNVNDDPTGSVTISGTATEEEVLTADTSTIADADGLGAFSYQWYRDGVAISGATGSTYTLTNDDVGAAITVGVSYTDANGTAESLTSDATAAVTNVNDDPTGSVTISGTATEDQTLSADTSTIADADGLGAFSYQWYRDGVAISGATGSTYTLTNDDVGAAITVGVSYTDANGTAESLTSDATAVVTNVNDDPTGSVTISGTATEEEVLTADTSTIADADGLGAFSYQWYRDGVAISGATGSTYTLTNDDVGAAITVGVSYTDANGTAESLTSDATAAVTNVNDDPTGSVTISGTATEDQTLSADTSTIADADGLGAFSYQWYRDGVAISGATGSTYTLTNDDVGAAITVGVSYTDANGTAESLTSDATAAVTNVNDDPTGSVTISGTATEEEVLSADTSTIADADGLGAFSYQWYRDGVAISGATNSTYTLSNDDVGAAITVGVSYTDANGTAESLTSDATAAVTNVNEEPSGAVIIWGSPVEDQLLYADTSTIADPDGLGVFSYQWYRDGVAISGATNATYRLGDNDVGATITASVSYTDGYGTPESLTSDATAAIANVNDAPTGSVTISGTATEGERLSADASSIADIDGLGSFAYQWYRDGSAISGATGSSYTLTSDDVGAAITVEVSYNDAHGTQESLTSTKTDKVAEAKSQTGHVIIEDLSGEDADQQDAYESDGDEDNSEQEETGSDDAQAGLSASGTGESLTTSDTQGTSGATPNGLAAKGSSANGWFQFQSDASDHSAGDRPDKETFLDNNISISSDRATANQNIEPFSLHPTSIETTQYSFGLIDFGEKAIIREIDQTFASIHKKEALEYVDVDSVVLSFGTALSAGFVSWVIRSSVLTTAFLTSVPVWQGFDPLVVMSNKDVREGDDDDQEADPSQVERIFDEASHTDKQARQADNE